jgi:tetratricopeptide (TPR) repeat protein
VSPRRNIFAACLLFLAFFFIYLSTACSSVFIDDSGETASLAWTLSIGHPPGYPLHTLLGHLFCFLPLGDPALRMNVLAAALGAFSLSLAFLAAGGGLPGIFAACLFGLGETAWQQAGLAKGSVYMLNNALSLGCLLCLQDPQPRWRRLFWLFFGLGLAHHYMSQLVLLPCYGLLMRDEQDGSWSWEKLWDGAWLALPGISLYLYLPLRAALNPAINWGAIQSWSDFLFFFSRAQYAGGEFSRSLNISLVQLWTAWKDLFVESHGIGLALALWALLAGLPKFGRSLQALAAMLLAPVLAVTLYLNLSGSRLEIMQPYLFPAYLAVALLAAEALKHAKPWVLVLWLTAAALPLAGQWQARDKSNYYFGIDSARNSLACLPKNSAFFCAGDSVIFPIWYLQNVKHEREDVALVGTPVLPMAWVRDGLAKRAPWLKQPLVQGPIGAESVDRLVGAFLTLNLGKTPLYFSYNKMNPGLPFQLLPQGQVYLALPSQAKVPAGWLERAKRNLAVAVTRGYENPNLDLPTMTYVVGDFAIAHNALANYLEEEQKQLPGALAEYRAAAGLNPKSADYPYNCGNVLHEMGRYEEALPYYRHSLDLNPDYAEGWYNLAATEMKLGRQNEACYALNQVQRLDPGRKDILPYLANCPKPQ